MPDINKDLRYRLEIDGKVLGRFADVSMSGEDLPGNRKPGGHSTANKLKGQAVHGVITLKRGIADSLQLLYEWCPPAGKLKGSACRKVAVLFKNEKGRDVAVWRFAGAWLLKYDPPDFNAKGNEVSIETLEIVHEGMERV
jgi:phage tail-like protein